MRPGNEELDYYVKTKGLLCLIILLDKQRICPSRCISNLMSEY